jgi:hypothetical protein
VQFSPVFVLADDFLVIGSAPGSAGAVALVALVFCCEGIVSTKHRTTDMKGSPALAQRALRWVWVPGGVGFTAPVWRAQKKDH